MKTRDKFLIFGLGIIGLIIVHQIAPSFSFVLGVTWGAWSQLKWHWVDDIIEIVKSWRRAK